MEQVIADLEEAAGLLNEYDPAQKRNGMLEPDAANTFLGYRAVDGYYAVKLCRPRPIFIWIIRKKALKARKVIDVQERLFP